MSSFRCAADMKQIDPLHLADAIHNLEAQEVNELHFDVADGHFIAQFGFAEAVIRVVKERTNLPCHAHLLVEPPDEAIPRLIDTGVDAITIHVETCTHIHRALSLIRSSGRKAGIALTPATALTKIKYCLPDIDRLLVLGTDPVRPSTPLPRGAFERIRILSENIRYHEYAIDLEVEGPRSLDDAARCVRFGANRLVVTPDLIAGLADADSDAIATFRGDVEAASHTV